MKDWSSLVNHYYWPGGSSSNKWMGEGQVQFNIFADINDELAIVEEELRLAVRTSDPLLTETATHLINAGGKRLRPAFCLLGGRFCHPRSDYIIPLAVALELAHMATLVHDDVVDSSLLRRGTPTVKARWGNRISSHVGDFLLGKAMMLIAQYNNPLISRTLSDTSVKMCEGEILQIATSFHARQDIKDYFYRIERKTALLIAASCQLGAVAFDVPNSLHLALRRFGHHVGMAFQITDDILDMTAEQLKLGKPVGSDLQQGIVTLPTIYALKHSPQQARLHEIVIKRNKTAGEVNEAIELITHCGGIDYAQSITQKYIAKAKKELDNLPDVPAKKIIFKIADFVGIRNI